MSKTHHVYLVDGSGYIFRAYHALPPLTRSDGTPTGAATGFGNMLWKLLRETEADRIAVVFDAAGTTFRHRIYDQYKAHRPEPPNDLVPQFRMVRELTNAFNVCRIEEPDYEADDLIATYACQAASAGSRVTIVSSDKDLMQMVSNGIGMYDPIKEKAIGPSEVREKFGVPPNRVIDVQALCGDSIDNVPGVRGISAESAGQLIQEYGDLESLLERAKQPDQLKREAEVEARNVAERIFSVVGRPFNLGSPKQLGDVLFIELGLPGGKKGKTGNYGVNTEVLSELSAKGIEVADLILRWRFLTRVSTTFADLLAEQSAQARISKQLVTLNTHVPLPVPLEALEWKAPAKDAVVGFLRAEGFRALATRVETQLESRNGAARAEANGETRPSATAEAPPVSLPQAADLAKIERRYELVQDLADLDAWIAAARVKGVAAIATAATSTNPATAELLGLALAIEPGEACYIPLAHRASVVQGALDLAGSASGEAPRQIPSDAALARLKPLLEDEGVLKVGHDIKDDVAVMKGCGIRLAPINDTMLVSYVLTGGARGQSLAELAEAHFGHATIAYKDVAGTGKNHIGLAAVALEKARDYAAEDADIALRLHRILKPRLLAERRLAFYETIERPLVAVVAEMERAGIRIDRAELHRLSEDFAGRLAALEREIHTLAGHPFNIGSPKQLGEVLFDELALPGGKKMKTGAYGTDAALLEQLALTHELPARVLDWRQLAKLKSTYTDALREEINPATGRVHTRYQLAATLTGRLSSIDPNLQNIPIRTEEGRKIRRAFVAEEGRLLISADYSQIELRLAAHLADVAPLKEAFRTGADIHALTASEVFGVPMAEMTGEIRRRAKAINFGILYGMSAFGLAQRIQVPQSEAAAYIKAYFERFPGIRAYMERAKAEAREKGYVETMFGRRCYIPGIKETNPAKRGYAEREAINAPLQGTAADIIKRAMIRVPPALAQAGLDARMLLQVHDELVFEATEAEAEKTAAVVKDVMERAAAPVLSLSVPLVVETGMAHNWDDAH